MLPFMKRDRVAGLIIAKRKPDGSKEEVSTPESGDDALLAAADDIIRAINLKDSKMLAVALRSAFEICDAAPHVEGPHVEEEQG